MRNDPPEIGEGAGALPRVMAVPTGSHSSLRVMTAPERPEELQAQADRL